jgi:hypothetical protein
VQDWLSESASSPIMIYASHPGIVMLVLKRWVDLLRHSLSGGGLPSDVLVHAMSSIRCNQQ